jgi:hypothetical protein
MAVISLSRSSQSYPGVPLTSQGGFGVTEVRLSALYPSHHLGSFTGFLVVSILSYVSRLPRWSYYWSKDNAGL